MGLAIWLALWLISGIVFTVNHEMNFHGLSRIAWITKNLTDVGTEFSRMKGRVVESIMIFDYSPGIEVFSAVLHSPEVVIGYCAGSGGNHSSGAYESRSGFGCEGEIKPIRERRIPQGILNHDGHIFSGSITGIFHGRMNRIPILSRSARIWMPEPRKISNKDKWALSLDEGIMGHVGALGSGIGGLPRHLQAILHIDSLFIHGYPLRNTDKGKHDRENGYDYVGTAIPPPVKRRVIIVAIALTLLWPCAWLGTRWIVEGRLWAGWLIIGLALGFFAVADILLALTGDSRTWGWW